MFFEYALTIPANTAKAAPSELEMPLSPGTVVQVGVQFPPGCRGLVHVQIWREEHQVWPVNLDGDISADGIVVSWPEDYDLDDDPFSLTLRGWSVGTSFDHTITARFALLPLGEKEERKAGAGLLRRLVDSLIGGG